MTSSLRHIAELIGAESNVAHDSAIDNISIDSRSLQNNEKTLFFALKGPNNDGHRFIAELFRKGVRNFVVEEVPAVIDANFLVVRDTLGAFQKLAAGHRATFSFPVIGITGSNGKTIVKEWLNFLLAPEYNIIRSPKSYNSQVGVPLSVIGINERHNLGIFEAGISRPGEMRKLEEIIRPDIGILTNIGSAHDEGFESEDQKIAEKLALFGRSKILICNHSAQVLTHFSRPVFTWTFTGENADVRIVKKSSGNDTRFDVAFAGKDFSVDIPFSDDASTANAATCLATMLYLGYDAETISRRVKELYPVEMRLKVKNGINGTAIIDDSYSSDFQSLRIALDFLESQKQHKAKTAILSDIFQSGLPVTELYDRVSDMLKANGISRVIGIGPTISEHVSSFSNISTFPSTEDFLRAFRESDFAAETILVKGARQFGFERIVSLLEEKTHETVLEINPNAVSHNLNFFRSKLSPGTKLMVMVKAFGYGNGGFEIARLLEYHKADYLGVAFADEGISLKSSGITLPIMVLNPESTSFGSIIQHNLEPEIYSIRGLKAFIRTASEKGVSNYPVHIKIDTGMHRLGFEEEQLSEVIEILRSTERVGVRSILSHMATSDDREHHDFALAQIALFDRLSQRLMKELDIRPIRHLLNTSGISNYPEAQYDMVRLGIGLYGVSNDPSEQSFLENVGTLKSIISQLRTIGPGESVGYGRRFIAGAETRIATIPIGYADGIPRLWGTGNGYVMISGKPAPIVGSVCMDMLMADCTGIDCSEGDPVIIFGERPTVIEMASKLGTIPYEILTSVSQRVKRIFFRE